MKKTLDRYSVLFVYYTITKGDIMNNLDNQTTRPKTGVKRQMKVIKGDVDFEEFETDDEIDLY